MKIKKELVENIITEEKDFSLIPAEKKKYVENNAEYVANEIIKSIAAGTPVNIAEKKKLWKGIVKSYGGYVWGDDCASYFLSLLNKKLSTSGATNKLKRSAKKDIAYKEVSGLSPEEFKEAADYLQKHITKIEFGIPKADSVDPIINRLLDKYTELPMEKLEEKAEKLFSVFNNYNEEFFNLFPDAVEGRDYHFRRAENQNDKDPHVDLWHMMASTTFDENISKAPAAVIKMMEKAQEISKNETKDIEEIKQGNIFNSYYFALAVLKMFDNDLTFYIFGKKNHEQAKSDPFDQDFPGPVVDENLKEGSSYSEQVAKMQALERGTRGFNAKAASNDKLRTNRQICQSYNLPTALDIVETEMVNRGLIPQTTKQAQKQAAAQPAPQPAPKQISSITFKVDDFHAADAIFVKNSKNANAVIADSDKASEGQIKVLLRALIFALILGKESGYIQALKLYLTDFCEYSAGEIKATINKCLANDEIISRLNLIKGEVENL